MIIEKMNIKKMDFLKKLSKFELIEFIFMIGVFVFSLFKIVNFFF